MQNLGLRKKFIIFIALTILISLVQSTLVFTENSAIIKQSEELGSKHIPIFNKSHELKLAVIQVQQWLTDISATRGLDGLNDGFDEAENNAQLVRQLIKELTELDEANSESYQGILPSFEAYYATGIKMAQEYIAAGPSGGNLMMSDFDTVAAEISAKVQSLLEKTTANMSNELKRQGDSVTSLQNHFIFGSLAILFCIGILYYVMNWSLAVLPAAIRDIQQVAEGNMSISLKTDRRDEIGLLLIAVETLKTNLCNMVGEISDTAQQLITTSHNIKEASEETKNSASNQSSETRQAASAMTQMTATVHEVARNIELTAQKSNHANTEANKGKKLVVESTNHIENLSNQLSVASDTILQLEQDTQSITGILDVIKGISEQTNLLALNAAIEAARAGEQGRGFAVVADEVRALASRTQEATEEINNMLDKLLIGSRSAVSATNDCKSQALISVEHSSAVRSTLDTVAQSVTEITDMSNQVAVSTEQQATALEEINRNVICIDDISNDISTRIVSLSSIGDKLQHQATDLDEMIHSIKRS